MEDSELRLALEKLLNKEAEVPVVKISELRDRILKEKARLKKGTRRNYEILFDRLERFSETWFVSPYQVNEFLARSEGIADTTVKQWFALLRAIGHHCKVTYGWPDPTEGAMRPKAEHKRRRYFTQEELDRIIEACETVQDKALIYALLDSSCRIGELASLREGDLKENSFVVHGKTGERSYRCDPVVIGMLRESCVEGVVFPTLKNGSGGIVRYPVEAANGHNLAARARLIVMRAGLKGKKLGPHTLRHTVASLVARETKSALAVKAMLQHDNVQTSMIYIHDVEDSIQQEISPLSLAGVKLGLDRQLTFDNRPALALEAPGESEKRAALLKLIDELMPVVPDDVVVRPALSSDDLRLVRDGLVELMKVRNECGSGSASVQLMVRMLRKCRK